MLVMGSSYDCISIGQMFTKLREAMIFIHLSRGYSSHSVSYANIVRMPLTSWRRFVLFFSSNYLGHPSDILSLPVDILYCGICMEYFTGSFSVCDASFSSIMMITKQEMHHLYIRWAFMVIQKLFFGDIFMDIVRLQVYIHLKTLQYIIYL